MHVTENWWKIGTLSVSSKLAKKKQGFVVLSGYLLVLVSSKVVACISLKPFELWFKSVPFTCRTSLKGYFWLSCIYSKFLMSYLVLNGCIVI